MPYRKPTNLPFFTRVQTFSRFTSKLDIFIKERFFTQAIRSLRSSAAQCEQRVNFLAAAPQMGRNVLAVSPEIPEHMERGIHLESIKSRVLQLSPFMTKNQQLSFINRMFYWLLGEVAKCKKKKVKGENSVLF